MPNLLLRNFQLAHQADRFYVVALVATNVVSAAVDLSALLIFPIFRNQVTNFKPTTNPNST